MTHRTLLSATGGVNVPGLMAGASDRGIKGSRDQASTTADCRPPTADFPVPFRTAYCLLPTAYFFQVAALTVLCLALYLPGLRSIPPLDRDEARFAQATRQMVQSGDFIHPHFQDESRLRKPIGIYWLQTLSVAVTGATVAIWPYRLPSVIGATVAVLLTLVAGRVLFPPAVALAGAALLAAAVLLVVEAHMATTDASLLAAVVAAQSCLGVLYASSRAGRIAPARYALGFWIAQGVGILLKGPIAPLVSGLTVVSLMIADRMANGWSLERSRHQSPVTSPESRATIPGWRRQLRPAWGVLITAAIVLPWAAAIAATAGPSFYREWLGDVLPKLTAAHESHGAPPGSYLLMLPATFWPGSFAAGLAILVGVRRRAVVGVRFCLAWLVPTWIFFELMPTKLPQYVLPLYPALALLSAVAVATSSPPAPASERVALNVGLLMWALVSIAIGVGAVAAPYWLGTGAHAAALLPALTTAGLVVSVARLLRRDRLFTAARLAPIGAVLVVIPIFAGVLPELDRLWLCRSVARAIAQWRAPEAQPRALAAVGYHEPSLVFLSTAGVALVDANGGVDFLSSRDGGLLLLADDERARFDQIAGEQGLHVRELWAGNGFNYSKGKNVSVRLLERASSPVVTSDSRR